MEDYIAIKQIGKTLQGFLDDLGGKQTYVCIGNQDKEVTDLVININRISELICYINGYLDAKGYAHD